MVTINGDLLTFQEALLVSTGEATVKICKKVISNLTLKRERIDAFVKDQKVIYGVTTGFGAFKNTCIPTTDVEKLQRNLILSHATGVGAFFEEKIVRTIMLLIINYLAKNYSGARPVVLETLSEMLNKGVIPMVPSQGSVGSSGDLAPSAHIILVLIGEGEASYKSQCMIGEEAMKKAGITPLVLQAKEGLALINNTATMTANAIHAIAESEMIADVADISGALSCEALRATTKAFDSRIHAIKPHNGQVTVATHLRDLLNGSTMIDNTKVQDQYSLRCIPQIHGAIRDALQYAKSVVEVEMNSVTDNPLFFEQNDILDVLSGGNFHGEPLAIAMDTLGLAMCEYGNIADRRIASLLDPATNNKLPPFLAEKGGLNSGFMILQYTTAALVSENKVLAHPASVDSIPTSANVEDLVSMGSISARKARTIIENVKNVLAIELIAAAQAIDFRKKEGYQLSKKTAELMKQIRTVVPYFAQDSVYYPYFAKVKELMSTATFQL